MPDWDAEITRARMNAKLHRRAAAARRKAGDETAARDLEHIARTYDEDADRYVRLRAQDDL